MTGTSWGAADGLIDHDGLVAFQRLRRHNLGEAGQASRHGLQELVGDLLGPREVGRVLMPPCEETQAVPTEAPPGERLHPLPPCPQRRAVDESDVDAVLGAHQRQVGVRGSLLVGAPVHLKLERPVPHVRGCGVRHALAVAEEGAIDLAHPAVVGHQVADEAGQEGAGGRRETIRPRQVRVRLEHAPHAGAKLGAVVGREVRGVAVAARHGADVPAWCSRAGSCSGAPPTPDAPGAPAPGGRGGCG